MIEGKERLACSVSCGFVFWDNPVLVVAALVELEGEVVLVQNKAWPKTSYGLVTGFLEQGESPEQAALREVGEELGLIGEIRRFIGYYPFFQANQLILAFHVEAQGQIVLGDELTDFKRLSPAELRPWPFGTGPAVRDWLRQQKNSIVK